MQDFELCGCREGGGEYRLCGVVLCDAIEVDGKGVSEGHRR